MALETASDEIELYLLEPGHPIGKESSLLIDRSMALDSILMELDNLLDG